MCTNPLVIRRAFAGKVKTDVVPCGKCHECISKKQNEFAALACLEAKKSSSMWFATLTYSNNRVPIMFSYYQANELHTDFVVDNNRAEILSKMALNMDGKKVLHSFVYNGFECNASLRREDFKLFLKRCRVSYEREFGVKLKFTYAAFGEYGDRTHRPHYHALFFGLTDKQASYISSAWSSEFGFSDFHKIPVVNSDGSPAHVKVSKYVSKYLSKPKKDFLPLLEGKVEAPRRVSSIGFGLGVLDDNVKNFTYAKI